MSGIRPETPASQPFSNSGIAAPYQATLAEVANGRAAKTSLLLRDTQNSKSYLISFYFLKSSNGFNETARIDFIEAQHSEDACRIECHESDSLEYHFDLKKYDPSDFAFVFDSFYLNQSGSRGQLNGRNQKVEWNLHFHNIPDRFNYFSERLSRWLPTQTYFYSPGINLSCSGKITIGNTSIDLDRVNASIYCMNAKRLQNSWSLLTAVSDDGKTRISCVESDFKFIFKWPSISTLSTYIKHENDKLSYRGPSRSFRTRSQLSFQSWKFEVSDKQSSFEVVVQTPSKLFLGTSYENSDGHLTYHYIAPQVNVTLIQTRANGKKEYPLELRGSLEHCLSKQSPYVPLL